VSSSAHGDGYPGGSRPGLAVPSLGQCRTHTRQMSKLSSRGSDTQVSTSGCVEAVPSVPTETFFFKAYAGYRGPGSSYLSISRVAASARPGPDHHENKEAKIRKNLGKTSASIQARTVAPPTNISCPHCGGGLRRHRCGARVIAGVSVDISTPLDPAKAFSAQFCVVNTEFVPLNQVNFLIGICRVDMNGIAQRRSRAISV